MFNNNLNIHETNIRTQSVTFIYLSFISHQSDFPHQKESPSSLFLLSPWTNIVLSYIHDHKQSCFVLVVSILYKGHHIECNLTLHHVTHYYYTSLNTSPHDSVRYSVILYNKKK